MTKCQNCGKEMSEYATVCPNCGCPAKFSSATYEESSNARKRKTAKACKLFAIGISAVLLIISVFVLMCAQNAYHAMLGDCRLSIGSVFFEQEVINGEMSPIMTAALLSICVFVLCAGTLVGIAVLTLRKRKCANSSSKGKFHDSSKI